MSPKIAFIIHRTFNFNMYESIELVYIKTKITLYFMLLLMVHRNMYQKDIKIYYWHQSCVR